MQDLPQFDSLVCPECGSSNIIHDRESGEIICGACGLVITESTVNKGPEWRAFDEQQKKRRTRVGAPLTWTIHDKGLSTTIDWHDRDANGKKLSPDQKARVRRIRKWHRRSRLSGATERNLAYALSELVKDAYKLNLSSSVLETASMIYRKALKRGLVRGRSIEGMAAASLYAACRLTQTPRTLGEVASRSKLGKREIGKCYRLLLRRLNLHMPVPNPQQNVPKIAAKLGIDEEAQRIAVEILREAKRLKETAGKSPMALAASALYVACDMNGEHRTQETIAEAAGVTEVTIRNVYKDLAKIGPFS
jgi:transcription initiation factor TFIIB